MVNLIAGQPESDACLAIKLACWEKPLSCSRETFDAWQKYIAENKLFLQHTTDVAHIDRVLAEGLKSRKDSGASYGYWCCKGDVIYLIAVSMPYCIGHYQLMLNMDWFAKHLEQFAVTTISSHDCSGLFEQFAEKHGLAKIDTHNNPWDDETVSLKPIPLEGLEFMIDSGCGRLYHRDEFTGVLKAWEERLKNVKVVYVPQ